MLKGKLRFPRFFTIMLVPHSQQSTCRLKIPIFLVCICFILLICAIISAAYFAVSYIEMKKNMAELKTLRSVNIEQREKLKELEEKTNELENEISEVERLKNDVKIMLQSGELASRSGGGYLNAGIFSRISRDLVAPNYLKEENNQVGENKKTSLSLKGQSWKDEINKWEQRYSEISRSTETLTGEISNKKAELTELKKEVVSEKEFLAARPSGLPVTGRVTSGYGERNSPVTGRKEFHPALDIAASYGMPVKATGKGEVVYAGYKSGYGKTVIVEHKFGFRTLYSHNSRINVSIGETVSRGDNIALVGSTGTSTGPHLHYEVILHGENKNPADYLY